MNLPAHDTNNHLLVQVPHHKHAKRKPKEYIVLCASLALSKRRQVKSQCKPPGGNLKTMCFICYPKQWKKN